jgi:hypothetical protein
MLHLAGQDGWDGVTLGAVARATHTPLGQLKKIYAKTHDLVPLVAEHIDREAFGAASLHNGPPDEILFDLLMARFDVLQKNRAAILSMAKASRHDRALGWAVTRAAWDGMYRLLEAAHLTTAARPLYATALAAIYGWTFVVWSKDTSRDMAKTMAALDRALKVAAKVHRLFPLPS